MDHTDIELKLYEACEILKKGGIVAYPTESVYGLGCDPYNIDAVTRLLQLKKRSIAKGFILIASSWEQIQPVTQPISPQALARVFSTWPGPVTWVFPAQRDVPYWIRGDHKSIAVRVTDHPQASALCLYFGGPVISTSANFEGHPPIRDRRTLELSFGDQIDYILPGSVGGRLNPSEIRDAISGEILRKA